MALAGKSLVIKVSSALTPSTSQTGYTTVAKLNSATMEHEGTSIDVSDFSTTVRKRLLGLTGNTYTLSGFYTSTDTNGQSLIRSSWASDTTLAVTALWDGSTGFKQEVKVTGMSINGEVDGAVEVTYNLEGTGAVSVST